MAVPIRPPAFRLCDAQGLFLSVASFFIQSPGAVQPTGKWLSGLLERKAASPRSRSKQALPPDKAAFYADPQTIHLLVLGHSLGMPNFIPVCWKSFSNQPDRAEEICAGAFSGTRCEFHLGSIRATGEKHRRWRPKVVRDQASILLASRDQQPQFACCVPGWPDSSRQAVQPKPANKTKRISSCQLPSCSNHDWGDWLSTGDGISLDDVEFLKIRTGTARGVPSLPIAELEGWHFNLWDLACRRWLQSIDDGIRQLRANAEAAPSFIRSSSQRIKQTLQGNNCRTF